MTDEEILELAKTCGFGVNKYKICICWKDELLKFSRSVFKEGYHDGVNDGQGHD